MLRVVLADDSLLYCDEIVPELRRAGPFEVHVAHDGAAAVAMVCSERPDVAVLDIQMPVMNGLEAIREIMAKCPTPILVMTSTPARAISMEALSCGALEVIAKPSTLPVPATELDTLVERLRLLASISVVRHPRARRRKRTLNVTRFPTRLVAIAASTGGPTAVATVLKRLPADFQIPIVIAQHLDINFSSSLAAWLDAECELRVQLLRDGDVALAGHVHVIPPDRDAILSSEESFQLVDPGQGPNPNADRLFHSIAMHLGSAGCGVVLTGMGRDGAEGLAELREAGGLTLAQDGASSTVDGMPRAARERGAAMLVLPLGAIGDTLLQIGLSR